MVLPGFFGVLTLTTASVERLPQATFRVYYEHSGIKYSGTEGLCGSSRNSDGSDKVIK